MTCKRDQNVTGKMMTVGGPFFEKASRHRRKVVIALVIVLALPTLATLFGMSKNVVSLFQAIMVLVGFLGLVYLFADAIVNVLNLLILWMKSKKSGDQE